MNVTSKILNIIGLKFVYMLMLAVLLFFSPPFQGAVDAGSLAIYISIFFIASVFHLQSQNDKNWFRLDVIFLLGFGKRPHPTMFNKQENWKGGKQYSRRTSFPYNETGLVTLTDLHLTPEP